jgi:predicted Zn-dependent protease
MLEDDPEDESAVNLLEKIIAILEPASDVPEAAESWRRMASHAAELLKRRYTTLGRRADVARVIEAELRLSHEAAGRAERLRELFHVRRSELSDREGAFECLCELVLLQPEAADERAQMAELAVELGAHKRLAETLVAAAENTTDADTAAGLLWDAASLYLGPLEDPARGAELCSRVLSESPDSTMKLRAARTLDGILNWLDRPSERCDVLEQLARLEEDPEAARAALCNAARAAFEELGDPLRAALCYRLLLKGAPDDRALLDLLIQVLRAGESWVELCEALAHRARLLPKGPECRRDLGELARYVDEKLARPDRAIDLWRLIRQRYGREPESTDRLIDLLERRGSWAELASLLLEEAQASDAPQSLFLKLATVHRDHTGDRAGAVSAFIAAGDLLSAAELLENASDLRSEDPLLSVNLSEALKNAGQLAAAERILRRQLDDYGERRPTERGIVHLKLAEIRRAASCSEDALAELLVAAKLSPSDPAILAALGLLSIELGDLERADESYRIVLLLLHGSHGGSETPMSRAEAYVELSEVALRRNEPDQVRDYVASAFEVALGSEKEALGLERALRRRGRTELLARAIEVRFDRAEDVGNASEALADLADLLRPGGDMAGELGGQALVYADRLSGDLAAHAADAAYFTAARRLVDVYRAFEEPMRAATLLSAMASRSASSEDRSRFELEAVRLMLDDPHARGEALHRLRALVHRDPSEQEAFSLLSRMLEDEGRLEEVLNIAKTQLSFATSRADSGTCDPLRLRVADLLERTSRFAEALDMYSELSERPELAIDALRAVVRIADAQGWESDRLADALERLLPLEQGPAHATLALRLATLRRAERDAPGEERALVSGLSADPDQVELRDALVRLYFEQQDWEKAVSVLQHAVERSPNDALLRMRLAECCHRADDTDGALQALAYTPAAVGDQAEVRWRRFLVLDAADRKEEALIELDAAHELVGTYGAALLSAIERTGLHTESERWALRAAGLLSDHGEPARACEILETWLAGHHDSVTALRLLADLTPEDGDCAAAIGVYRRLSLLEDGEARSVLALKIARLSVKAGQPGAGLRDLEDALSRAPENAELRTELRKLYGQLGAHDREVRMLLDEAQGAADPTLRGDILFQAAQVLHRQGAIDDALEALIQVRSLDPEAIEAAVLLARILAQRGRRAEALDDLRKLADTHPQRHSKQFWIVHRQVAEIRLAEDELLEALEGLSEAHYLNKTDAETALVLGLVALDLDELDVANSALRSYVATVEHPTDTDERGGPNALSRAYYHIAWIEHVDGHDAVARRMASRAIEESSQNDDAQRLLQELGTT